jgi:hypothetical protein
VNQAQRRQVQVLHVFAEAIKLTKDALASLCSSAACMRGRIVISANQEWYPEYLAEKRAQLAAVAPEVDDLDMGLDLLLDRSDKKAASPARLEPYLPSAGLQDILA